MKVLMINGIYGTRSSGRSMLELTNKLRGEGHDVYIASPQKYCDDPNFYRIGNKFDHKLHGLYSRLFGKQAYYSKCATKKLIKYVDEIRPDVIHIQVLHGNYINFNLFFREIEKRKIPLVYVLDDCWPFTGKCSHFTAAGCYKWQTGCGKCPQKNSCNPTWFFDRTKLMWRDKKRAYEKMENFAVIAVSDWLLGEAQKSIMKNAKILKRIYNSIDTETFKPTPSDLRDKLNLKDKFVILGVATLIEESKGLSSFIKLAEQMPDNWEIVFVGGLDQSVKLPKNIKWVGKTESVFELAEYYSFADVFVQMSIEETFGKVTAEALSCGTPVVVFNSTANPELAKDGCGYVVEPKDVNGVMDKLKLIEKNGKDFYTQNCRTFILDNMDKDKTLGEFIEVYQRLVEDRKC